MSTLRDEANLLNDLLDRARGGCPDAARQLTEVYGPGLLIVVRRRLNRLVRTAYDSTDFTQMVWLDFFETVIHQNTFANPQQLLHFLQGMVENKILALHRHELDTQKADRRRQVSLDNPAAVDHETLVDVRPTAQQLTDVNDALSRWFDGLPAEQQTLLRAIHKGWTVAQIAHKFDIDARHVHRMLRRVRPPPPEANAGHLLAILPDAHAAVD